MTGKEDKIGGFDLICRGTPMTLNEPNAMISSMLGCTDNRSRGYIKLAKEVLTSLQSKTGGTESQLKIRKRDSKVKSKEDQEKNTSQPSTMSSLDTVSGTSRTMLLRKRSNATNSSLSDANHLSEHNLELLRMTSESLSKSSQIEWDFSESTIEVKLDRKFSKDSINSTSMTQSTFLSRDSSLKLTPKKKLPKIRILSKQSSVQEEDEDIANLDKLFDPKLLHSKSYEQSRLKPIKLLPVRALNMECAIKIPLQTTPNKSRVELPSIVPSQILLPLGSSSIVPEYSQDNNAAAEIKGSLALIKSFRPTSALKIKREKLKMKSEGGHQRRHSDNANGVMPTDGKTVADSINIMGISSRPVVMEKSMKTSGSIKLLAPEMPKRESRPRLGFVRNFSIRQKLEAQKA